VATFALLDATTRVGADQPVPPGDHTVELAYLPARGDQAARAELRVDGTLAAEADVPGTMFLPHLSTAGAGLLIGRDRGLSVSPDYRPPFQFTGALHRVELHSGRRTETDDERAARVRAGVAGD